MKNDMFAMSMVKLLSLVCHEGAVLREMNSSITYRVMTQSPSSILTYSEGTLHRQFRDQDIGTPSESKLILSSTPSAAQTRHVIPRPQRPVDPSQECLLRLYLALYQSGPPPLVPTQLFIPLPFVPTRKPPASPYTFN